MREYELKRGVAKALEGDGLRMIAAETFAGAGTDGNRIVVSFGAIERMVAWTDGKKLYVDTTMKSGAPDHVATDTIKAFNTFLEGDRIHGQGAGEEGASCREEKRRMRTRSR